MLVEIADGGQQTLSVEIGLRIVRDAFGSALNAAIRPTEPPRGLGGWQLPVCECNASSSSGESEQATENRKKGAQW